MRKQGFYWVMVEPEPGNRFFTVGQMVKLGRKRSDEMWSIPGRLASAKPEWVGAFLGSKPDIGRHACIIRETDHGARHVSIRAAKPDANLRAH